MSCDEICEKENVSCRETTCRNYLEYKEDLNCVLICARKNGPLTLEESSKRLGVSYVRIKQIEDRARAKIKGHIGELDMSF
jgi:DNA-directed RNA polymerase sigma subunit (sigma70/sigma32)